MAKLYPMFSSSKGNCTYVGGARGGILVDAGVSFKKIETALTKGRITLEDIKAIAITHEHADHISGLKVLLKHINVPIIASRDTIYALEFLKIINDETPRIYADENEVISIEDITICRFATNHDCKGSSGYTFKIAQDVKMAVCTDLGGMTEEILENLKESNIVMLESNYDPVMLRMGPYPPELKLRVGGENGHLSNAVCADTVAKLFKMGCNRFVLAHLSENNNTREKAGSATNAALFDAGAKENDYILYIAPKQDGKVIAL